MKATLLLLFCLCFLIAVSDQKDFMVRRTNSPTDRPAIFTKACVAKCHESVMKCIAKSFDLWKSFRKNKRKIAKKLGWCCTKKFNKCVRFGCGSFTYGCKLSKKKEIVGEVPAKK